VEVAVIEEVRSPDKRWHGVCERVNIRQQSRMGGIASSNLPTQGGQTKSVNARLDSGINLASILLDCGCNRQSVNGICHYILQSACCVVHAAKWSERQTT